jgi:hypothetical protein
MSKPASQRHCDRGHKPHHRVSYLYQNSYTIRFDRNKDVIDLRRVIHSIGPRRAVESERPAIPSGGPWKWKI